MSESPEAQNGPHVVHADDVEESEGFEGEHWGHAYKVLTPSIPPRGSRLGVNQVRLPPGRTACPFHYHHFEDEVFYVLRGRGVLRYGDELVELKPGDCVSCPAGTTQAHQIANPYDEDLVYLGIGVNHDHEVCEYPDTGKTMVRAMSAVGRFERTPYMDGEPELPEIFRRIRADKG